jgi:isoquinoline 1-oxidoreductase subunit beta
MTHMFNPGMFNAEPIAPGTVANVSRRFLLKGFVAAGTLVLGTSFLPTRARAGWATGAADMPGGTKNNPHLFIAIDPSGIVTIMANRVEMGTGIKTSLPMVVADEMDADWSRVRIEQATGDNDKWGNEDTDGSRSVRHWVQPMRQCGAAMRMMLEQAAAKRWGVDPSLVRAENHKVVNLQSNEIAGYGELAKAAMELPAPPVEAIRLKDPRDFRYIGTGSVQIYDLRDITMGKAIYGIDARIPGMKYAVIARPPVVGGKLVSFDATEAMKVPGVEKVLEVQGATWPLKFRPLGGVAVIARNTGSAIKGREKLKIVWDDGPNASYDSKAFREQMEASAGQPGLVVRDDGDAEGALKSAARVISATYYIPHLAHASMEPPVATAHVANGECVVYAPLQYPGDARDDLADVLSLPKDKVTVHPTLLGGAFGRKCNWDFAIEAAVLSKATGAPIKVTWTREDDLHHGPYHTVSVERIDAGVDANGKLTAWRHRSVAPSLMSTFHGDQVQESNIELGMGFVDNPFYIPNLRCENPACEAHVRIGWFRSVSNIPHAFAIQSMVGELAAALGRDQRDMLLELIGPDRVMDPSKFRAVKDLWNYGDPVETYPIETGRLRRVVEIATEQIGWGKTLPKGEGLGIAAHRSFLSYIATAVHVVVDNKGNLSIPRVDTVVDCGFYINPERIRSQTEGAAVMGTALAKNSEITFKAGRAQQSNFDSYLLARITEVPLNVNVHIVPADWNVPSSGVGEPPLPPFAPALCNAIYAATGKRIRSLPIGGQLST